MTLALISSGPDCSAWCQFIDVVVYTIKVIILWIIQRCRRIVGPNKGVQQVNPEICTNLATRLDSLNDRLRRPNDADVYIMGMEPRYFKS